MDATDGMLAAAATSFGRTVGDNLKRGKPALTPGPKPIKSAGDLFT